MFGIYVLLFLPVLSAVSFLSVLVPYGWLSSWFLAVRTWLDTRINNFYIDFDHFFDDLMFF